MNYDESEALERIKDAAREVYDLTPKHISAHAHEMDAAQYVVWLRETDACPRCVTIRPADGLLRNGLLPVDGTAPGHPGLSVAWP